MNSKRINHSSGSLEGFRDVDWGSQLADVKEVNYQNILLLTALIDVLTEKGLIQSQEIREAVHRLDGEMVSEIETDPISPSFPSRFPFP